MTLTTVKSAYPASVEVLMPRARDLAQAEGLPSQNRLKDALRIGRPKARDIRAALEAEGFEPTEPATVPNPGPATEPTSTGTSAGIGGPADTGTGAGIDEPAFVSPVSGSQDDTVELDAIVEPAPVKTPNSPVANPGVPTEPAAVADTDAEAPAEPEPTEPAEAARPVKRIAVWPVLLLMLPATVAIWSGWVGLGKLAGFGPINPLPGIWDSLVIDTSITLPIGMETYSAYALYVWLSGRASAKAVSFARASALLALAIGSAGQVAYHLIAAPDAGAGPVITAAVACIPVAVLGLGAALAHLVQNGDTT